MNPIKDIKRHIKEATMELDTTEYIEFMQELSQWAEDEAALAEYLAEYSPADE